MLIQVNNTSKPIKTVDTKSKLRIDVSFRKTIYLWIDVKVYQIKNSLRQRVNK